ncbi:MAG: class I SAM-dependent methyltransferase [Pyrinomonadaceae bacterium]
MSKQPEWWETFFTGLSLDLWRAVVTEEQTRAEADFIERTLQLPSQAKVLDVPCGGGRHALELASRGFLMNGVDIAQEFVEEAQGKAAERNLNFTCERREMRDLPWHEEFDGAYSFGNSFGYLTDEGNAEFLHAVSRTLKPGARFLLETGATAESLLPHFAEHRRYEVGAITMLIDNRYDHESGRLYTDYTFTRDGREEKKPGSQRVYTYRELCRMLEAAGFQNCVGSSSPDGEPFKLGAQRLYLSAVKSK